MRVFVAFIIALLIYILLIWVFLAYFPKLQIDVPQKNNHIITIDIQTLPDPIVVPPAPKPKIVQPKVVTPPKVVAPTPVVKKKPLPKKVVPKKPVIKKALPKKVPKKRPKPQKRPKPTPKPKKHVVKKRPIQETLINKKRVVEEIPFIEEPIAEPIIEEISEPVWEEQPIEPIATPQPIEEEIPYIPEPIIHPQPQPTVASDLGSFLSTPTTPTIQRGSYPNEKIKTLYGASFHTMTSTQKEFIANNLDTIQQITQAILTQRGYPEGAGRTKQEGTNVVTFNLHPNGNISNLRLKTRTGYRALDENTLSLVRVAYKDYPYPSSTTKMIFYVTYSIYGY